MACLACTSNERMTNGEFSIKFDIQLKESERKRETEGDREIRYLTD